MTLNLLKLNMKTTTLSVFSYRLMRFVKSQTYSTCPVATNVIPIQNGT